MMLKQFTRRRAILARLRDSSALLLIAADQALKSWCGSHLRILSRRNILGQKQLVLSRFLNRGMAFDRFSDRPVGFIEPFTRYLPTAVWAVLLGLAVARWKDARSRERLGFTLLIAGGGSNLWDHWRSEYVVDTLQIHLGQGQYLPFNLADLGILLGTAFLALSLLLEMRKERQAAHDDPSPTLSTMA